MQEVIGFCDSYVEEESCRYCGDNCPNDHEYMCDGYSGDIDNLYEEKYDARRIKFKP